MTKDEQHRKAMTEASNHAMEMHDKYLIAQERIENPETELNDRKIYCDALCGDLDKAKRNADSATGIIRALRKMAHDDFSKEEIGTSVIFLDYLLTEMEVHHE